MEINFGDNMDDDLVKYVKRSGYRTRTLKTIGTSVKMPKEIAEESDILLNHISTVLSDLKGKGIIECLNPTARKGRLYRITEDSLYILNKLD